MKSSDKLTKFMLKDCQFSKNHSYKVYLDIDSKKHLYKLYTQKKRVLKFR